jgi:1-deoxy-D-xylulose-5-phosphate synthase
MAMDAAAELEKQGISVKVVNARFIKPLDEKMLHEIFQTSKPVITVEEAVLQGGFGSAVLEFASEHGYYDTRVERMGIPDRFIEHGSVTKLLEEIGLTKEEIINRVKKLVTPTQKRLEVK